ncbi:MAG: FAD-dependent oxidoreductase [Candidatus ainarchaeum sp.]|nr:FAD-dependent oxidoreductase [Candidatus ainarchaeum sp.]
MAGARVLILGAGPSGLSAGWKLAEAGAEVAVLEKGDEVGGQSKTFSWKGMRLDYGPHKIYTQNPRIKKEVESLFGRGELLSVPKRSRMRLLGKYFGFPVKMRELLLKMSPLVTADIGARYAFALARSKISKPREDSYESYMMERFGGGTYRLIFGPYARKVWGEPRGLSASLAKSRIAVPSLLDLAKRLVAGDGGRPEISAKEFYYPRKGVFELSEKMAGRIRGKGGKILFGSRPSRIVCEGNRVAKVEYESRGRKLWFEPTHVVSTIPLAEAASLFEPQLPPPVIEAAGKLSHRNLVLAVIVVRRDRVFPDNWLFFPEEKYVFNRVYEQKGFSAEMVPEGMSAVCAEITCSPDDVLWNAGEKQVCERVVSDLAEAEVIARNEVAGTGAFRMELAYPVYDARYEERLKESLGFLDRIDNFFAIGRNGSFNYAGMLDCMDMGIRTAEHIVANGTNAEWREARKGFQNYVTVD